MDSNNIRLPFYYYIFDLPKNYAASASSYSKLVILRFIKDLPVFIASSISLIKFGKEFGYSFETEAEFDRFCLVNDAVYVARDSNKEWTATGAQFAVPYVFKTLFTHEPTEFSDMCETKSVLDKVSDKQKGCGVVLCLIDKKTYLKEDIVALPIEYI